MTTRQRRWDDCSGDPCICPKPAKPLAVNSGRLADAEAAIERVRAVLDESELGRQPGEVAMATTARVRAALDGKP